MSSISVISNAKERHVRPDENNIWRLGEIQGNSYPPSSTFGGQISNNLDNVQNHAKNVNGGVNSKEVPPPVPQRTSSREQLLQTPSIDDSLTESNCCVGKHNIKITGDQSELVQMAKLVLDDYFSSNKFLQSGVYNEMMNSTSSTHSTPPMAARDMMPISQLKSSSPFADNSMGFNIENVSRISNSSESVTTANPPMANCVKRPYRTHFSLKDLQEEIIVTDTRDLCAIPEAIHIVHKHEQLQLPPKDSTSKGDIITDTKDVCAVPIIRGLTRSRRTHFSRKDLEEEVMVTNNRELCAIPEAVADVHIYEQLQFSRKDSTPEGDIIINTKDLCAMTIVNGLTRSRRTHFSRKDLEGEMIMINNKPCATVCKYQHDREQLIQYSKTPLSLMLPKDWIKICEMWPSIVRK